MAKLEIEKSNMARLIALNSSVEDFNLKTFISATENTFRILANPQIPLEVPLFPVGHKLPAPLHKMGNSDVWAQR